MPSTPTTTCPASAAPRDSRVSDRATTIGQQACRTTRRTVRPPVPSPITIPLALGQAVDPVAGGRPGVQ
ncbi:hypothetical protein AB0J83_50370, partial [Actinoplanes sp. NPDC049596]|uniref:hypothetical protein n=1 Tax=Actinoplanes sp. NPDC049596 TaxID=3154625 RepID=UPI00342020E6